MSTGVKEYSFISWLFGLFIVASVGFGHGAGILAIVILFTSIAGLVATRNKEHYALESWEWIWIMSIFCLNAMMAQGHGDFGYLDPTSRLLLAIPVYLFIRRVGININAILIGSFLGALVVAGFSWYQYEYLNMSMSLGITSNHIFFGQTALILGFFSFCGFFVYKRKVHILLAFIGALLALYALIISGSRGGWIAIPAIFIFLFGANVWIVSKKNIIATVTIFVLVSIGAYTVDNSPVKARINVAISDINLYVTKDHVTSSVGARFEMWKGALLIAKDSYFLGVGEAGYSSARQQLIDDNRVHKKILHFDPHNMYLNTLAKQGVFGLIALLLIMLIPLRKFYKDAITNSASKNTSIMGAILVIAYLDFMLTTSTFIYQYMVVFYIFILVALLGNLTHKKSLKK